MFSTEEISMKKWVDADLKCIDIANTKFSTETNVDFDAGYIGEGIQGFMQSDSALESEEEVEEAVEVIEFFTTDAVS